MKCDKLKAWRVRTDCNFIGETIYIKQDVDEAIAELKEKQLSLLVEQLLGETK